MPAEWEPHAATWLAWPHHRADWPGKFEPIPWVYAEIIRHLTKHERVELIVNDAAFARQARKVLERADAFSSNIRFHHWPTNRVWLRDSGCIFLRRNPHASKIAKRGAASVALKFRFNAWAKYSNWRHDEKIGSLMSSVARGEEIRLISKGERVVLEGGSIDVNGAGSILTTEECLLSEVQQRNPGLGDETTTQRLLETAFHDYLGIDQTLWLNRGCAGDDTHGHIDDIARFVPGADNQANTILACVEPNTADENHIPLAENLDRLRSARNLHGPNKGKPFQIVELPMPAPVVFEGQRLPASYANFYIANGLVLVPTFNDPQDRHALNIIARCFPTREIIGIHAVDLVWGLGTLHCLSQQEPA